jgi:serine O-acetyltransferase
MTVELWTTIKKEIGELVLHEPELGAFYSRRILQHESLAAALSDLLSLKLASADIPQSALKPIFDEAYRRDESILDSTKNDLLATRQRDPAVRYYSTALLYFKGFQALQAYRVAHWLWQQERQGMALWLQSQISEVFTVDIHPAAKIGSGILVDHATGIVIGETCILDNNISIMQGVTLGGTGKDSGDRHPKIKCGVLIGTGAIIIGNVTVGERAKVAAGSVVLKHVEPHTTVAGIPAVVVGKPRDAQPAFDMDHDISFGD